MRHGLRDTLDLSRVDRTPSPLHFFFFQLTSESFFKYNPILFICQHRPPQHPTTCLYLPFIDNFTGY